MARPVRDESRNRRSPAGSVGRPGPSRENTRCRHWQRPGRPDAGPAFPRSAGNGHRQRSGGSGPGPGKFRRLSVAAEAQGRSPLPPTHEELLLLSAGLLSDTGVFSLIVPSESEKSILRLADRSRLHLHRLTRVYSKPSSRPRRILATFGRQQIPNPLEDTLTLTDTDGTRSPGHTRLTRDFYLEY